MDYKLDLYSSEPLDYWHSLLIEHDGPFFYWTIYDGEFGGRRESDYPHTNWRAARLEGLSAWRRSVEMQAQRRDGDGA